MNEYINKWLENNYQKYLKTNPPLEQSVYDHILDWMNSTEGAEYLPKLWKMPVSAVILVANKWSDSLNKKNEKKLKTQKLLAGVDIIKEFPDGFKIVLLKEEQAYMFEGVKMGHCVYSYFEKKDIEIYSLRDQNNEPHCTIEFDTIRSKICQIKGKANLAVISKYHKYIADFLNEFKFERIYSYDLKNICSIYFGNYIFLNDAIPENLVVNKDLKIEETNFIHTFNRLEVKGDVFLSKNRRCRKIANELIVHGDLVIEEFHRLLKVADKLIVKGVVEITNCEELKLLSHRIEAKSICIVDCFNFNQKIDHDDFDLIFEKKEIA